MQTVFSGKKLYRNLLAIGRYIAELIKKPVVLFITLHNFAFQVGSVHLLVK